MYHIVADTVTSQSESTDYSFESSLLNSVKDNDLYLLSFLLSISTNPDAADKNGQTALIVVKQENSISLHNSNPNIQNNNGRTPLYIASQEGPTDTVDFLLKPMLILIFKKLKVAHLSILLV